MYRLSDEIFSWITSMGWVLSDRMRVRILTSRLNGRAVRTPPRSRPLAVGRGFVDGDRQPGRGAQRFLKISDRIEAIRRDCLEMVNKGNGNVRGTGELITRS